MNRNQLIAAMTEELHADGGEWTKADVKTALEAFESVVTSALCSGDPVTISGFVKFVRKDTPAKPSRPGRNPATGETIQLKPKPASVAVRTSPLKKLKDTVIESSAKSTTKASKKAKKKKGKKKK